MLQEAQYKLRMSLDIPKTYNHCLEFPIHGSGQGSVKSKGIWLFILLTLFDIQEKRAQGAWFCSPQVIREVTIYMVGFMDDTNGVKHDFQLQHEVMVEQQMQWMQQDAHIWSNI